MDQNLRVLIFGFIPLLLSLLHILVDAKSRTRERIIEVFLLYLFGIAIGANGLFSFVGHFFFSDMVAESIGWPAGNPFQLEIAFTNLALGVLGVLSIRNRGGFRTATAIAAAVFLLGADVVHVKDIVESGNFAPGNAGLILFGNFLRPAVIIGLLIAQKRVMVAASGAIKSREDRERWRRRQSMVAEGGSIGLLFGVMNGVGLAAAIQNEVLGIISGVVIGVSVGFGIGARRAGLWGQPIST